MSAEQITSSLKAALRRMPAAVGLITTRDPVTSSPAGLAASAIIPVSLDPPSMLVAINMSASAHKAIEASGHFCINLLGLAHTEEVATFSRSELREERFKSAHWSTRHDMPYLVGAAANIFCRIGKTVRHGTHELFIGDVFAIEHQSEDEPLGWYDGGFARVATFS